MTPPDNPPPHTHTMSMQCHVFKTCIFCPLPPGLQVVFGGGKPGNSALGVALLRTGGIITGVLLFMGLTVVILPKSATIEALRLVFSVSSYSQMLGAKARVFSYPSRENVACLKLLVKLNTLAWTNKHLT